MSEPGSGSEQEQPEEDAGTPDIFPTVYADADDAADVAQLALAEQAVARNGGTPEQRDGVARAATARRAEERLERWRGRRR